MNTLPLLIQSNVIIDDVRFADGSRHPQTLGGAAAYAAVAASHWWPQVAIVAGVGEDFEALAGAQLAPFGLRGEGLLQRDAHTIQSRLQYFDDGERSETAIYGPSHFQRLQLTPGDIPASLLPAVGSYVFRDLWPAFWKEVRQRRTALGRLLWEIDASSTQPQHRAAVEAILPIVDIFSINRTEAQQLLGQADPIELAMRLLRAGARELILRLGSEGALVCDGHQLLHVRPPPSTVVDVTGGGNSFSAGFLAGSCARHGDLKYAARCAAASAAVTLQQHGLPPPEAHQLLAHFHAATTLEQLPFPLTL